MNGEENNRNIVSLLFLIALVFLYHFKPQNKVNFTCEYCGDFGSIIFNEIKKISIDSLSVSLSLSIYLSISLSLYLSRSLSFSLCLLSPLSSLPSLAARGKYWEKLVISVNYYSLPSELCDID